MSQGVTFDITARVTGYEQSLKLLRDALLKLDPGANIAKSIQRGLETAEGQIKSLGKNLTPQIINDNQLDRLTNKLNITGNTIEHLGEQMQKVTSEDVSTNAVKGFTELNNKLIELEKQLSTGIQNKFLELINNSTELSDAFKVLNLNVSGKNSNQILEELNTKLQEAAINVSTYEKEYNKAVATMEASNNTIKAIKLSPFVEANSKADLTQELHNITDSYTQAFKELRETVAKNLQNSYGSQVDVKPILDSFFSGLNADTIKNHLESMMNALNIKKGEKRNFYKQIFGADENAARDINTLITSLGLPSVEEIQTALREWVEKISQGGKYGASGSQEQELLNLINKGDVEKFAQEAEKDVASIWKRVQDASKRESEKVNQAAATLQVIDKEKSAAKAQQELIDSTIKATTTTFDTANNSNAMQQLRQEINEVNHQLDTSKEKVVDTMREVGKGARQAAQQYQVTTSEVNKYSFALEKVKQREQLVGKIEGIVQRWFSIYAAVRMVTNAIKSMISTIKELDKTITDIAIVTDMSQEDLWKQMPQYTAMAKEYAVSISGVYKVSQLFYQQGLQTNDVMRLSAETLKLARIAGIEYADAANYMTNAIRSFKMEMEDAGKVTDVYSALAAASATSVSELAEAMSKTASSANSVGSSLENTSAMIAVMTEATRESASNIGSALKSIISRYGEMKASPKDILSIDGEEASFNKVDTALKSIGISLKNAQGQFRNFDDVIMELASVWDTLDNNTQRYIATIMAGNRQQSRFIALVSSGERLKELSKIAAESEDAAQLQFLKTLDSIEAKTQQLQTSLQNLYTSAGLEELYKGLLDIGANVLNYYNNISNTVSSGIHGALIAIAGFGTQFYNLSSIVLKVLRIIKTHYINNQKQLDLLSSAHAKLRANETLTQEERMALRSRGIYLKTEQEKTKIHEAEERKRAKITAKLDAETASMKKRQAVGGTLYGVGTVASIVGTTVGGDIGAAISAGGSVMGAVGAFMTGNWIGGIMSTISAITSLISLFPSLSKRIEETKKKLTELRNTESQVKSEQKNLESAIKQEEELRKNRYKSEEDAKAYQEALNKLGELAPELILSYTTAGDAIIDVTKAENALAKAREKTRKATYDAAVQEFKVRQLELQNSAVGSSNAALSSLKRTKKRYNNNEYEEGTFSRPDILLDMPEKSDVRALTTREIKNLYSAQAELNSLESLTANDELLLKNINTILSNYNNIIELSQIVMDSVQTAASAYLLSNKSSQYKFIEGSSGLQTIFSKKISKTYSINTYDSFDTFITKFNEKYSNDYKIFEEAYSKLSEEQVKLFDKMVANPQLYSKEDFKIFDLDSNIIELIGQYFNNSIKSAMTRFTQGVKNIRSSTLIKKYIKDIEEKKYELTDTEVDFLLEAYQVASNLVDDSLTRNATQYFNSLFSAEATEALQTLSSDNKEVFYNLWQQYGITTKAGIQNIIDELINNYDFDEDNIIITSLKQAKNALVENVALSIQSAADKFSENWKTDSENISKLTSGIEFTDITKTIAAADKLGLKLTYDDFIQNGEKFILNAEKYDEYIQKYFESQKDATKDWSYTVKRLKDFVDDNGLKDGIDYQSLLDGSEKNARFLKEIGFDKTIEGYVDDAGKLTETGLQILKDLIQSASDNLKLYNWLTQQANNSLAKQYLDSGNIQKAIKLLMPEATSEQIQSEIDKLAEGNYAEVSELIKPYLSSFISYFNDINKTTVEAFINSLTGKGAQVINITDDNRKFLQSWNKYATFDKDGKQAIVDFSNASLAELQQFRTQVLSDALKLTDSQKKSVLSSIEKEVYETRDYATIVNAVANTFQELDRELAERYAKYVLGFKTLEDAVTEGAIAFDEVSGKYSIDLKELQYQLYKLQNNGKATPEQLAQLQDIILGVYEEVANSIIDAFNDGLNNVDYTILQNKLKELGIKNIQGFYQRGGKWYLSEQGMYQLYSELLPKDAAAANRLLEETKKYLTDSGRVCENIYKTIAKIAEIQKKLSDGRIKDTKELQTQLKLYRQIAEEQFYDSKQFKTMSADIPEGIASPLAFAQNIVDFKTIGKEVQEAGYATDEQFYQLINTLHSYALKTGEEFTLWGQKINSSEESVINAMINFSKNAKGVNGKLQVSLKSLGGNFDFSDGINNATNEVAKAWADYADNIANFYQGIADIEKLGGVNLENIFEFDEKGNVSDWAEDGQEIAKKYVKGIITEFQNAGLEVPQKLTDLLTALNDPNTDTTVLYEQINNLKTALSNFDFGDGPIDALNKVAEIFSGTNEADLKVKLEVEGTEDIEDAQQLLDLINKYLEIGADGVTITGVMGSSEFTVSITDDESGQPAVTFNWADGSTPDSWEPGANQGDLDTWLTGIVANKLQLSKIDGKTLKLSDVPIKATVTDTGTITPTVTLSSVNGGTRVTMGLPGWTRSRYLKEGQTAYDLLNEFIQDYSDAKGAGTLENKFPKVEHATTVITDTGGLNYTTDITYNQETFDAEIKKWSDFVDAHKPEIEDARAKLIQMGADLTNTTEFTPNEDGSYSFTFNETVGVNDTGHLTYNFTTDSTSNAGTISQQATWFSTQRKTVLLGIEKMGAKKAILTAPDANGVAGKATDDSYVIQYDGITVGGEQDISYAFIVVPSEDPSNDTTKIAQNIEEAQTFIETNGKTIDDFLKNTNLSNGVFTRNGNTFTLNGDITIAGGFNIHYAKSWNLLEAGKNFFSKAGGDIAFATELAAAKQRIEYYKTAVSQFKQDVGITEDSNGIITISSDITVKGFDLSFGTVTESGTDPTSVILGFAQKIQILGDAYDELQTALNTVNEKVDKLNKEQADVQSQLKAAEAELEELKKQKEALDAQLAAVSTDKENLENRIKEKDAEITNLRGQKEALNAKLDAISTEKESLEQQISEKNAEIMNLKGQLEASQSTLQDLRSTTSAAAATWTKQVESLNAEISNKDNQITELNKQITALEATNAELAQQAQMNYDTWAANKLWEDANGRFSFMLTESEESSLIKALQEDLLSSKQKESIATKLLDSAGAEAKKYPNLLLTLGDLNQYSTPETLGTLYQDLFDKYPKLRETLQSRDDLYGAYKRTNEKVDYTSEGYKKYYDRLSAEDQANAFKYLDLSTASFEDMYNLYKAEGVSEETKKSIEAHINKMSFEDILAYVAEGRLEDYQLKAFGWKAPDYNKFTYDESVNAVANPDAFKEIFGAEMGENLLLKLKEKIDKIYTEDPFGLDTSSLKDLNYAQAIALLGFNPGENRNLAVEGIQKIFNDYIRSNSEYNSYYDQYFPKKMTAVGSTGSFDLSALIQFERGIQELLNEYDSSSEIYDQASKISNVISIIVDSLSTANKLSYYSGGNTHPNGDLKYNDSFYTQYGITEKQASEEFKRLEQQRIFAVEKYDALYAAYKASIELQNDVNDGMYENDSEGYAKAVAEIRKELLNEIELSEEDWSKLGDYINSGIFKGLLAENDADETHTLENWQTSAFDNFMKVIGAGSPAVEYMPIGNYIVQGIGEGIASGNLTPYINKLIQKSLGKVNITFDDSNKTLDGSSQAKGNAQAKGTLMGELGPELYVTGGHYYIAGQNGAEFVDLPNDAIVFNHLQTKRLMASGSTGRGSAISNEKRAVAHASGNVAMASAQEMANKWRGIADMFRNLGKISASDLAKGGGKGGGNDKNGINLHDLDRWYNLMRQIEKVEEQITYQQKLRENMRNGSDYIKSMEYELALLEKEQANYQLLAKLQKSYYEARRKDQEKSIYGKIFTYDSDGLMQYRDGAFRDALAKMEEQRTTGVMKYTNEQQKQILTNYLRAQGVSQKQINAELNYKTDGTKVKDTSEWIENFWDKFDGWIEEMDSMYDSYTEYQTKVQEMIAEQNKILEEYRDLQLDLEGQLLKAIEDREQAVIDKLQDTYDAINESSQKYIDGLSDALSREQDMYNRNQENQELTQMQRRLAILQRSGGSGSEILSLQKQIESQLQENYFSEQQSQIDAIKEASDAQLEKLQQQIDIAQETLEYQKEHGLFWSEVTSMMREWTPVQLADFIKANSAEMFGKSPLDVQTTMEKTLMDFEKWYELQNRFGAFNDWYDNEMTNDVLQKKYGVNVKDKDELTRTRAIAKEAYQRYYADEAYAKNYKSAEDAAKAALLEEKNRKAAKTINTTKGVTTSSSKTSSTSTIPSANNNYWYYATKEGTIAYALKDFATKNRMSGSPVTKNRQEVVNWLDEKNAIKVSLPQKLYGYNFIYNGTQYLGRQIFKSIAEAQADAKRQIDKLAETEIAKITATGLKKKKQTDTINERAKNAKLSIKTYDTGGMVDQTGIAIVHAKEGVLKPEQVEQLRKLTSSNTDSMQYKLTQLQQQLASIVVPLTNIADNTNNSITIENATVEMNIDSIANDYDVRRAGQQALEEMLKIARKTSVQSIRR